MSKVLSDLLRSKRQTDYINCLIYYASILYGEFQLVEVTRYIRARAHVYGPS